MGDFPFIFEEFIDEEGRPKVNVQPVDFTIYGGYKKMASTIYNLKFRPGDVVIVSTPRSGNHWTQEMVWTIVNNADTEAANKEISKNRVPMLEVNQADMDLVDELRKKRESGEKLLPIEDFYIDYDPLDVFENLPSPRVCTTHLPLPLLPPNLLDVCKVIYITRNPADLFCSFYPYWVARHRLNVDFDTCFQMFLKGTASLSPYWTSVKEAWKVREHPNMLFLLYEDMKKDLRGCIEKVSIHVEHPLTEEQVDKLEDHLSFQSMKSNPSVNRAALEGSAFMKRGGKLIRKGEIGESKKVLTEQQMRQMKEWCDANRGECNIKFPGSVL